MLHVVRTSASFEAKASKPGSEGGANCVGGMVRARASFEAATVAGPVNEEKGEGSEAWGEDHCQLRHQSLYPCHWPWARTPCTAACFCLSCCTQRPGAASAPLWQQPQMHPCHFCLQPGGTREHCNPARLSCCHGISISTPLPLSLPAAAATASFASVAVAPHARVGSWMSSGLSAAEPRLTAASATRPCRVATHVMHGPRG